MSNGRLDVTGVDKTKADVGKFRRNFEGSRWRCCSDDVVSCVSAGGGESGMSDEDGRDCMKSGSVIRELDFHIRVCVMMSFVEHERSVRFVKDAGSGIITKLFPLAD